MASNTISTRELLDPTVTSVSLRSTRQQYAPQIARLSNRDVESAEDLRRVLQGVIDQIASISGELSTLPFLGGVWIANQELSVAADNVIEHGLEGEVEVMAALPDVSAAITMTSQDGDARTVTITTSTSCIVSLLIFPKKRGA